MLYWNTKKALKNEGFYFFPIDIFENIWIEHSDVSTMIRNVDENEKVTNIVCTPGGNQEAWKNRMSMSEYIRNLILEDMKRKEDKK